MHDQKTLLRRAYKSGEPVADIAERFGCAVSTIYRAIGRQRRRKFRPAPGLIAKTHLLTSMGFTYLQISRALGLGRHRVLAEMRRARESMAAAPKYVPRERSSRARTRCCMRRSKHSAPRSKAQGWPDDHRAAHRP